jgi:hypothetical protein
METLMSACVKCRLEVVAGLSSELYPLLARMFNVVCGHYIPSRQVALMVWYMTALLSLAVLGYKIQTEPSGLVDVVPVLSF